MGIKSLKKHVTMHQMAVKRAKAQNLPSRSYLKTYISAAPRKVEQLLGNLPSTLATIYVVFKAYSSQ